MILILFIYIKRSVKSENFELWNNIYTKEIERLNQKLTFDPTSFL